LPVSDLAAHGLAAADAGTATPDDDRAGLATESALPPPGVSPFLQEVGNQSAAADSALAARDVDAAVSAVLAIDTQMHDWSSDTLDSDEQDRARETLRRYVVRLGDLARNGAADPREMIAPVVDRILDLRVHMRAAGEYTLADRLRDVLVEAGVEVRDAPEGSTWVFAGATTPG
jgi:cysteinyl-tRNA synthetase